MNKNTLFIAGAAVVGVGLLVVPALARQRQQSLDDLESLKLQRNALGLPERSGQRRGPDQMFSGLDLTDDQRAKLKALESEMPRPGQSDMAAHMAKVEAVLTPAQLAKFRQNRPPAPPEFGQGGLR
jgi:Spy/CpxP family protein refolding chaperone